MAKEKHVTEPVPLCCAALGDLDNGMAALLIDSEIQKAMNDLADRAEEDGKTRKVTIELEIGEHNGLVYCNVAAQAKLPARRSKNTGGKMRMASKGNHEMLFQVSNRDHPDQGTFADGEIPNDDHEESQ